MKKQQVLLTSGNGYWRVSYYDSNDRRRFKSLGSQRGVSRRKAKQLTEEFRDKLAINPQIRNTAGKAPRLSAWITAYLSQRTDISESTKGLHKDTGDRLIERFGAECRLDKITRSSAAEWRAWLSRQKDRRFATEKPEEEETALIVPCLSEATTCRHIRTAKVIFGHAVRDDLLAINPFDRLQGTPPTPDKKWEQLSPEHIEGLLGACLSPGWRAMIGLCSWAGLRRGEALRLTWEDVQWEKNRIIVRNAAGSVSTKARTREVLMTPELETLLLDVHDLVEGPRPTDGVSTNNLHPTMLRVIRRAGFTAWKSPFHTLRKWRATSWRDEYPEHVVDTWLGHSLDVSRKHYVTINESYYSNGESKDEKIVRLEKELKAMHEKVKK